jgi:Concanavalin A-like lectin/glucanases superfamily
MAVDDIENAGCIGNPGISGGVGGSDGQQAGRDSYRAGRDIKITYKYYAGRGPGQEEKDDEDRVAGAGGAGGLAGAGSSGPVAGDDEAYGESLSRGLVASYRLDETSGLTAADEVGGRRLTLSGTVRWGGAASPGLMFFARDDVDCVSDHLIETDRSFSVSAWAMLSPRAMGHWRTAAAQDGDGVSGFFLQYSAWEQERTWAFAMPGSFELRAVARMRPRTDEWVHLAGVHDADSCELRLYVDGQRDARVLVDGGRKSNGQFTIGRALYDGRPADWFDGKIRLVKVWNRALSDEEVPVITRVEAGPR